MANFAAALAGFFLGGSLIIAIGAQNAYVLRMGLLRHHILPICLFCALSDALLIVIGIAGLGALVAANAYWLKMIAMGGGFFLAAYAALAFYRALNPKAMQLAETSPPRLVQALLVCASFTFLNPHVYLDTVVLVGAFSATYSGNARLAFALGAVVASFLWFFSLGYGARLLAPLFTRAMAWRVLDTLIGCVMAALAFSLLRTAFAGQAFID